MKGIIWFSRYSSNSSSYNRSSCICIDNSSDIWHKYTTSDKLLHVISRAVALSRVVFMQNITYKSCYYLLKQLPPKGL